MPKQRKNRERAARASQYDATAHRQHRLGNQALGQIAAAAGGKRPPLPFRFGQSGPNVLADVVRDAGGWVQYPQGSGAPRAEDGEPQIAVAEERAADTLPKPQKRAISQADVMGHLSANEAARQLDLAAGAWEWLHLVAFSISPTHVGALSTGSQELIERTGQPQQIRENLVLGTAEANTAMLAHETALKDFVRRRGLGVQLWAAADTKPTDITVGDKPYSVPVASRIEYHFMFRAPDGRASSPVVLRFDPKSHEKPPASEYGEILAKLEQQLSHPMTADVEGIRTDALTSLDMSD